MKIEVNLFAIYNVVAGEKVITLSLEQPLTVREIIDQVVHRHPQLKPYWFNNKHELQAQVHVFLNGEEVNLLPQDFDTKVSDDDSLEIIPQIAGG